MTASSGSEPAAAGGLARHIPVLGGPVVEYLDVRAGGIYLDATFGAGGYTRAILAAADCRVIGIDRDQSAIARGADLVQAAGGRLVLAESRFSDLAGGAAKLRPRCRRRRGVRPRRLLAAARRGRARIFLPP